MNTFRLLVAVFTFTSVSLQAFAKSTALVAPGAQIEKVASGFTFTEGPATDGAGNVFFCDNKHARIFKWSLDGTVTLFRDKLAGTNGMMFDARGQLIVCEFRTGRAVASLAPDGSVTTLVSKFEGKPLNSPNDLWIDATGGIYFTDPFYQKRAANADPDSDNVYYLPSDRSRPMEVVARLDRPNGVTGSNDGKTLYIGQPQAKKTMVYTINHDGSLSNGRIFAASGADGIGIDERDNVYLATDSIEIWSPAGVLLEKIAVPEAPANLTWGGTDRKTLFITAKTSVYTLKMNVTGY